MPPRTTASLPLTGLVSCPWLPDHQAKVREGRCALQESRHEAEDNIALESASGQLGEGSTELNVLDKKDPDKGGGGGRWQEKKSHGLHKDTSCMQHMPGIHIWLA
jgi:hypothetical protein